MRGIPEKREEVRKIILALLICKKEAIPLTSLDKDYKEQEGEQIPWKEFGHISLFDYLKSMPKYVQLERQNGMYYVRGIASDKSKHVSSLVARQKIPTKKPFYTRKTYRPSHYFPRTARPRVHIPANILGNIIHIVREYPDGIHKEYILKKVNEQFPYVNISMMDLEEQIKELSHEIYVQGNLFFPNKNKTKFVASQSSLKVEENLKSQCIRTAPKYCISGDSDCEITIDDENDFSFVPTKNDLSNCHENNKDTALKKKQPISMFIQETVSKCNIQDSQPNNTVAYDIDKTEHDHLEYDPPLHTSNELKNQADITFFDEDSVKILVSERTKFRLEKLIQEYPNGIWCAELPQKYLQKYNISLNYIELGFNSVREFASYLPDIFQCKQFEPSGDFILYNAKHELTDEKKKGNLNNQNIAQLYCQLYMDKEVAEPLPVIVSSNTSNKLMPDGVMIMGESVGHISVIDLENRLQPYIEVFVEEVFTPSLFWVQLRQKRKFFNKLMEDLHAFYKVNFSKYKIPPVVLEKGLNCACLYNDQWHRGIIKTVKPDLQVTIMFYDYGTLKTYPPDQVYYLHRSFSYLTAQAIPCGLYNTKPCVGDQWSRGVTYEFALRTNQRPLVATIASTDPENNSMLVTLTDTMEEEDVHINDWLVEQNMAVHGTMVRIRPRNFPYYYYLECKKHYQTNSEYNNSSKPSNKKTDKEFIISKDSVSNDLYANSSHVLSASANTDSENYAKISQKSINDSTQSSSSKGPKELIHLFDSLITMNKLSNSSSNIKLSYTQLHPGRQTIYEKNNEFKKESKNKYISSRSSSSSKPNDSIPITFQGSCFVETQNKELYSTTTNSKDCVNEESEEEDVTLPKKCFINAVNLNVDSKCNNPKYDILPDDNIVDLTYDSCILPIHRKTNINVKNAQIGLSEVILPALRSSTSVNNESSTSINNENVSNSSDQVQDVTADCNCNFSNNNKILVSDTTVITEKENNKLVDRSTELNNISNIKSILTKTIHHDELIIDNNNIDSNGNSASTYDTFSAELQNTTHRIFNTLQKIYNTCKDDSNLDSDDLSSLKDCDISTCKTCTKISSNICSTNTDSTGEEICSSVYDTNINEKALEPVEHQSQLFLKNEDNCFEKVKLNKQIVKDTNEEVNVEEENVEVPTFNDNDVYSDESEWDFVGHVDDFFENYFLSDLKKDTRIQTNIENRVQITEINDDDSNKSSNKTEDISSSSENHTNYLESRKLEAKVINKVHPVGMSKNEQSSQRGIKNSCFIQKDKNMLMEVNRVEDNFVLTDVDNVCYKPQGKAKSLELMLHKVSKGHT